MGKIVQIAELSVYGEDDEILLEDLTFALDRGELAQLPDLSDIQYETLFDVLSGELSPDSGQVVLCDRNIVRLSSKNKKKMLRDEVSFLPRNYVLPRHKTIFQSLEFKLRITDTRHEVGERSTEILELVGLNSKAKNIPKELSPVERVKAALALAIVSGPDLLVCHKPFPDLNSKGIEEIIDLLINVRDQQDISMLLLTDGITGNIDGLEVIETNLDRRVVK